MNTPNTFSIFRQGASHKPEDKPGQDHARHSVNERVSLIALSDGHGGDKYFRSHYGSEIATKIAIDTLTKFAEEVDFDSLLDGEKFIVSPIENENDKSHPDLERIMRHVFMHICSEWHKAINKHWKDNPLTPEEEVYLLKMRSEGQALYDYYFDKDGKTIKAHLSCAYGCTLFGVAETIEGYWVAFQIGDGKCVAFTEDGSWSEPIPWDQRCFLNMTTSLSSHDYESFRYAIGKYAPSAIFVASDGMDDSYAPMDNLVSEYALRFLASIVVNGIEETESKIGEWLDIISERGSRDDMSLAYMVWPDKLKTTLENYIRPKIKDIEIDIHTAKKKRDNEKQNYERISNELIEIPSKIGEVDTDFEKILQIVDKEQSELADLKERREKKSKRINYFFQLCSPGVNKRFANKKEITPTEREKNLEQSIKQKANDCNVLDEKKRNLQEKEENYKRELPVLKKHVNEAEQELKNLEYSLSRLQKVNELLSQK